MVLYKNLKVRVKTANILLYSGSKSVHFYNVSKCK